MTAFLLGVAVGLPIGAAALFAAGLFAAARRGDDALPSRGES